MKLENIPLHYRYQHNQVPDGVEMKHCYSLLSNDEYWYAEMNRPFAIGTNTFRKGDYLLWNATQKILFNLPPDTFGMHFGILESEEE